MATDNLAQKFRATDGLDAGNEKVVNVALADRTVGTDGVNVNYVIQENTLQQYDSTRGYTKNFSVLYNRRVWTANADITSPAGDFDATLWTNSRTDPKWTYINTGNNLNLTSGDYANVDTRSAAVTFNLPSSPQDGDTIVVRDIGGNPGNLGITINVSNQNISLSGSQVKFYDLTIPYATVTFTFSNRLWQTTVDVPTFHNTTLLSTAQKVTTQANDRLIPSGTGTFSFVLPLIANDRDEVQLTDVYDIIPLQHATVYAPTGYSVGSTGKTSMTLKERGRYRFILDLGNKLWDVVNEDYQVRADVITTDTTLAPNQYVAVVGDSTVTKATTLALTLPTSCEIGDFVSISLRKMSSLQTVTITPATGDVIQDTIGLMEFPERSSYPVNTSSVSSLSINGATNYPGTYHLAYTEKTTSGKTTGVWYVAENNPTIEQVDPSSDANRARLGVIALATQAQAMVDHENTPNTRTAITPETLANRVATETRRGIARIATQDEVSQLTTATYADDTIVTPKKLNARAATETMRGLAEIATQAETNAGTDDTTIITPLKLQTRQATPTLSGIAKLVTSGGSPVTGTGNTRGAAGTGVYDNTDYNNIVTPKVLGDYLATELSQGSVYLATNTEVINGTAATSAKFPIVVTPEQLQTKTATESRIGFTQIATQAITNAGTNDFDYITPLKLQNRIASETLTGIARIATQDEFNSGSSNNSGIVTPAKIAQYFTWDRTSVNADSGLTQSGNLWGALTFDIQASTESQRGTLKVSTQALTDSGVDDTTAVTPKKLQAKVATESVLGIVQFATSDETTGGVINTKAVSPGNLLNSFSVDSAWQATASFRGTVKLTTGDDTWVGNTTDGSTQEISSYKSDGYAISPQAMNTALANYLPKLATAANSLELGGVVASSWARRDIAQSIAGVYTFSEATQMNNTLTTTGLISTSGGISVTSGHIAVNSGLIYSNDSYHYINLGTTGNDVASWGVYNGLFELVDSNTGNVKTTFSEGSISTYGSVSVLTDNSGVIVGNNSDIGIIKKSSSSGKLVVGSGNSFIVSQSSNSKITPTDTVSDIFKVDGSGNATIYGTASVAGTTNLTGGANIGVGLTVNGGATIINRLTVDSPVSINGSSSWASLSAPTDATSGYWSIEVTDSTVYQGLPGYAVPTTDTDPITGVTYVTSYEYVKAPGTLSQFGSGTDYTYQIWTPRATAQATGALAQTFWIRQYNPITGEFDDWGRMYTSNNPPTPGEIGATSTVGTTLKNLTITDWIKIGNIKIYPDSNTKTVKFEWIDDDDS